MEKDPQYVLLAQGKRHCLLTPCSPLLMSSKIHIVIKGNWNLQDFPIYSPQIFFKTRKPLKSASTNYE